MAEINVAIIGGGNCASSLVQGPLSRIQKSSQNQALWHIGSLRGSNYHEIEAG